MEFIQSRWKLFAAVGFAVFFLLTILIVSLSGTSNEQPQCVFTNVKPIPGEAVDVISDDKTALAAFSGHVEVYKNEERLYLPIKLRKLTLEGNTISPTIHMTMDCANVSIQLNVVDGSNWMNTMDVRFEKPSQVVGNTTNSRFSRTWSCFIPYFGLSFPLNSSFICEKYFFKSCMDPGEGAFFGLVSDDFKLDLHRDPEKIGRGEYTKPFRYC